MRALLRRLRPFALGLRRDRATGHLYYPVEGVRHYIRFREETIRAVWRARRFALFFGCYQPGGNDCVVDIGAGLGTEIVMLARRSPELRYVAVEIQPWVYECLCLTLAQLPDGFRPFGLAIGAEREVGLMPTRAGEDVSILAGGPVRVAAIDWAGFKQLHAIDVVDLLKINAEGAEADLLDHIALGDVRRVLVATHDFRAERGESGAFRTHARVVARLAAAGFAMRSLDQGLIYAEREG